MNCLILGGGGFLGSHLAEHLLSRGDRVRVLDRPGFVRTNLAAVAGQIEVVEFDLAVSADLRQALEGADVVFHLASTTVPASSNENPIEDLASNLLPAIRLLEATSRGGQRVVFFSSGGTVYGVPERLPIDEAHPTNPISSYGIHKLAIEKYLQLYHRLRGMRYTILRISNAYGERQSPFSGQGAVAAFLHRVLQGQPIEIWGDGSVVRDYIHVSDIAAAAAAAARSSSETGLFNVGSGVGTSLLELVQAVSRAVGREVDIRFAPSRAVDVPANVLAIKKAARELDWAPQTALDEGIRRMLIYQRSQTGASKSVSGRGTP